MDSYIPDILEDQYTRFLLRLERCPECHRYMVVRPRGDTFPHYYKLTFDAQAKAANLGIQSDSEADNQYICEDCEKAGKAYFICALCKEKKSSDKIKRQFGDPPEYLCADCYRTVSAEEWETISEKLHDEHRWDFT